MKWTYASLAAVVAIMFAAAGCKTTQAGVEKEPKKKAGPEIVGDIPTNSPFAKVTLGMPQKQVYDLIGQPSDTKAYPSGKSWIPWYYGSDSMRMEAIYKAQGRITFTGGSWGGAYKVYRIIYDPKEEGYAK